MIKSAPTQKKSKINVHAPKYAEQTSNQQVRVEAGLKADEYLWTAGPKERLLHGILAMRM